MGTRVDNMKTIAIIIPVYREAGNLKNLHARLVAVMESINQYNWKIILVNDGSPDRSWEMIAELAQQDRRVSGVDLSRNFGKEIALSAGVHEAQHADAVICMDADLQHPPEVIPELINAWQAGAEVVATIRTSTEKQPLLRRVGSHLYYWLMARISGLDMVSQTTDFRLYDRKVVQAFVRATERERLFRGIMDWMGFKKVYVEFKAAAREVGEAGYSYSKLWQLAINSMTSFSLFPLRITGYLGMFISSCSGLLLSWMLISNYVLESKQFTPLAVVVVFNTFLIGIVLMAIGLVALYIGTIHTEVINRPLYLIRDRINFDVSP